MKPPFRSFTNRVQIGIWVEMFWSITCPIRITLGVKVAMINGRASSITEGTLFRNGGESRHACHPTPCTHCIILCVDPLEDHAVDCPRCKGVASPTCWRCRKSEVELPYP